jgi:hypothetical protein
MSKIINYHFPNAKHFKLNKKIIIINKMKQFITYFIVNSKETKGTSFRR